MSGSLRGRRSKETTQSNTSSLQGSEVPLRVPEEVISIEVPQNEEIFGGKNGGRKGIDSAIRPGGANRGAYTLRNDSEEHLRWTHLEQVQHCTDLPRHVTFPVHTEQGKMGPGLG